MKICDSMLHVKKSVMMVQRIIAIAIRHVCLRCNPITVGTDITRQILTSEDGPVMKE